MNKLVLATAIVAALTIPAPAYAASVGFWGIPSDLGGQQELAADGVTWARAQTGVTIDPTVGLKSLVSVQGTTDSTSWPVANAYEDDEPNGVRQIPLATIAEQHTEAQALNTPLVVTLDMDHPWLAYTAPGLSDILAVDSYPTANAPNAHIGKRVKKLKAVADGRPVWAILQICSSSIFSTGVYPTEHREYLMIEAATNAGANMIWFFGGNFAACQNASDAAAGFNWTAYNSNVLPALIQAGVVPKI